MEKVINLLNDIETKADKILSRVSDDKARLTEEADQKMKSFDSKIQIETNEKLTALRAKANQEVELELSKIKKEQEDYLKQLDANFETDCEKYAEQIFNRILSLT